MGNPQVNLVTMMTMVILLKVKGQILVTMPELLAMRVFPDFFQV
jgi:hypothetical protein